MKKIFVEFESLLKEVAAVFQRLKEQYPDEMRCGDGCVDCCFACFDVSLIEAAYIFSLFQKKAETNPAWRDSILKRAMAAETTMAGLLAGLQSPGSRQELLELMPTWRLRCPLLSEDNLCDLYEARPLTCRVYGLPTAINGQGHVCGFSGFSRGTSYPTVQLDRIYKHLDAFSLQLAVDWSEKNAVPISRRFFIHEIFDQPFRLI